MSPSEDGLISYTLWEQIFCLKSKVHLLLIVEIFWTLAADLLHTPAVPQKYQLDYTGRTSLRATCAVNTVTGEVSQNVIREEGSQMSDAPRSLFLFLLLHWSRRLRMPIRKTSMQLLRMLCVLLLRLSSMLMGGCWMRDRAERAGLEG
mmetsp:Transcript_18089/g.44365  ORF Transcript_18089/g.44365 Transcript_18089/m.44365 type:complete len:148 (+) Transcript_18089:53-496(+)